MQIKALEARHKAHPKKGRTIFTNHPPFIIAIVSVSYLTHTPLAFM